MRLLPPQSGSLINKKYTQVRAPLLFRGCQLRLLLGSKIKHFRELHKQTGLPYSEMVSFSQRRS